MPRDHRLYLDDILDAIGSIRDYTAGMDFSVFNDDRKTQDAVARNLEIIGEAVGKLPESLFAESEGVEWRKITGLRNILAHEYFGISLPIVWDVVENKLDQLEAAVRAVLQQEPGPGLTGE
jgi:uncharacterized protein with HEPN domain